MVTKEELINKVNESIAKDGIHPIYEIYLMSEKGEKEITGPNGTRYRFPNMGEAESQGYFYDLDSAIECMHAEGAFMRDGVFEAGFILCRFPGICHPVGKKFRMYFVWDREKKTFCEADETFLFKHLAL